jgi:undecaprenyl-diphosphatase
MINNYIFFSLYSLAHQSIFIDNIVLFFASYFQYIVILSAMIFLLFHHEVFRNERPFFALKKKWKEIMFVFVSVISAWLSSLLLKVIFHTVRPFNELTNVVPLLRPTDYSFPSGHSTFFMALAIAIYLYHKRAGIVFGLFALLIGLSRIIAGVHYPIDILGGFILGGFISYGLLLLLYKKI